MSKVYKSNLSYHETSGLEAKYYESKPYVWMFIAATSFIICNKTDKLAIASCATLFVMGLYIYFMRRTFRRELKNHQI